MPPSWRCGTSPRCRVPSSSITRASKSTRTACRARPRSAEGGLDQVDVNCTGTTEDGGAAVLTGTTSEIPGASITELDGTFTATVDGEPVFETDTLGG